MQSKTFNWTLLQSVLLQTCMKVYFFKHHLYNFYLQECCVCLERESVSESVCVC